MRIPSLLAARLVLPSTASAPPGAQPNSSVAIAFLTVPWGRYIELTEHLAPAK